MQLSNFRASAPSFPASLLSSRPVGFPALAPSSLIRSVLDVAFLGVGMEILGLGFLGVGFLDEILRVEI